MAEMFGWMPDDLEKLTLSEIHAAHLYSISGDE
jgi:hypothetical protein